MSGVLRPLAWNNADGSMFHCSLSMGTFAPICKIMVDC